MKNNFEGLWEEEEQRFTLPVNNGVSDFKLVEARIHHQQQTRRFNGDVAELFLPRMIRTVLGLFGGDVASDTDTFSRPPPSSGGGSGPSSGPSGPMKH